jgi:transposase
MRKYTLRLSLEERKNLLCVISSGKVASYKQRHARILLAVDENSDGGVRKDEEIAASLHVHKKTIERVRERAVMEGIEVALRRKEQEKRRPKILQGAEEAHVIALCCSAPPEGRKRWTMQLLADKLISLEVVDTVSAMTVYRTLKKTN